MHLSIQRKKVTASSVTRSGMGMPNPWAKPAQETPAAASPAAPAQSSPSPSPSPAAPPPPPAPEDPVTAEFSQPVTAEEEAEGGFGVFLKQQSGAAAPALPKTVETTSPAVPAAPAAPPLAAESAEPQETASATAEQPAETAASSAAEDDGEPPQLSLPSAVAEATTDAPAAPTPATSSFRRPQSHAPAPTAAPAPMSSSTLQKMKNEGMYRNQYFKDAECFECSHRFKVSRSSRSAECPNCGAAIPLEDVEINMPTAQSIRTRGDVLIRKRGQVSAELIQCKDLRCQGILEAHVNASGDAIFRTSGTMIGEVRCRRFIVEKGSDVAFEHEIHADEVEIHARVTGTLFSSGPLIIGAGGSVNGDVTARSVSIEPGGELNGGMNIVRTQRPVAPPPPENPPEEG